MEPDPRPSATTFVVPAQPGPPMPLSSFDRPRDELDDALDDVFGAPDDGGAGPLDAGLLLGGAAAGIAGLTFAPSWVLVAGIVAFALGAVLPLRTFWRRRSGGRRDARVQAAIGDGWLLQAADPTVTALLAADGRCRATLPGLVAWRQVQVAAVTHAAVVEVATLLEGRAPSTPAEVRYVEERTAALDRLARTLADPAIGDAATDPARRDARADARVEVERVGGSAVADADALVRALRGTA